MIKVGAIYCVVICFVVTIVAFLSSIFVKENLKRLEFSRINNKEENSCSKDNNIL